MKNISKILEIYEILKQVFHIYILLGVITGILTIISNILMEVDYKYELDNLLIEDFRVFMLNLPWIIASSKMIAYLYIFYKLAYGMKK